MFPRGRIFICVTLLLTSALAGCLAGDEVEGDVNDHGDGHGHGDGNHTTDPNGGANGNATNGGTTLPGDPVASPIAAFVIDTEGPLTVGTTVTFNATASEDPEGSNLTYSWDFGDGIDAEGVLVHHNYTAAGNYSVVLTVTNGAGQSNTTNETVVIAEGFVPFEASFEGSLATPSPAMLFTNYVKGGRDQDDYEGMPGEYNVHVVEGVPAGGEQITFKMDPTATCLLMRVFNPEGKLIGSNSCPNAGAVTIKAAEHLDYGTYSVLVFSALLPDVDYVLHVKAE